MARSQAEKARTREKILTEAAAQIRDTGLESVSVARLMQRVDLTHGGFYNHFDSRADLLVEALERALHDGAARARASRDPARAPDFQGFVKHYLSRSHRDARAQGCALAALASDVARADESAREVMQERFEAFVQDLTQMLAPDHDTGAPSGTRAQAQAQAQTAACTLIGALLMSRVLTDPRQSDALLKTVREQLITDRETP